MIYPEEFKQLIEGFQYLPGIGEKSAERYVYSIYEMDEDKVEFLSNALLKFKNSIRSCEICGHLTNTNKCSVCCSNDRDISTICVVVDSKSVFKFEEAGKYNGVYHVLNGLISPINEINPEDINVNSLINRIDDKVKEIIIALNPSVEGEMTSLYIQKKIENLNKDIKLSRLSYGLPMGADIEYLDPLTIIRAIDDRKFLS